MGLNANDVDVAAIDRKREQVGLAGLTEAERTLSLVTWTEYEVILGGLRGFYHNSAGDHAAEAVLAFERLSARQVARALRDANAAFPDGAPHPESDLRFDQLERLDGPDGTLLDDLTDAYHAASGELSCLTDRFIVEHAADLPFRI
ncbi:DMP19 family protein [Deinococcus pimensis]|uniref:DMP19 family protein n=1 Tax=Deinococcus pimensis TaxID=309888 RepID=UPI0004869A7F|nr:DUF4375 domain-containing protein [Deinococcus pimensis]